LQHGASQSSIPVALFRPRNARFYLNHHSLAGLSIGREDAKFLSPVRQQAPSRNDFPPPRSGGEGKQSRKGEGMFVFRTPPPVTSATARVVLF
jgi:hypothetical protein